MAIAYPKPNQPARPLRQPSYPRRPLPRQFSPTPWKPPPVRPKPSQMPRFPLQPGPKFPLPKPYPPMPTPPFRVPPWVRIGGRFIPYLGWGLAGWELYQWWREQAAQPGYHDMTGWLECCSTGESRERYRVQSAGTSNLNNPPCGPTGSPLVCGTTLQVPTGWVTEAPIPINSPGCRRMFISYGPSTTNDTRMTYHTTYARYVGCQGSPLDIEIPWVPEVPAVPAPYFPPVFVPPWADPMDLPIQAPVPVPRPMPYRHLPFKPDPTPRPLPVPLAPPFTVPDVEMEPGAAPRPDHHEVRKPREKEKEKKGNLRGGNSAAWLNAMGAAINTITETDDFISAIYNALPWRVRRWRGRDGVWRDRDHLTHLRLARIRKELSSLSITKMVKNLAANQVADAIGGKIGRIGRNAISGNPYYRGLGGLQAGQRFTKDTWNDVLADLRAEAARNLKPRDYYIWSPYLKGEPYRFQDRAPDSEWVDTWYGTVRSPYWDLPPGITWERKLVKGSKQMIPWLQYTYNKRFRPRRGTAEWWRRGSTGFTIRERRAYRSYG